MPQHVYRQEKADVIERTVITNARSLRRQDWLRLNTGIERNSSFYEREKRMVVAADVSESVWKGT